ncbi:hypothetical protein [Segetibacter sp.]|uniref:hypothetical protein n=1 Tax=Segetibacter sp. TaxID=2231182 RepID=UPI00260214B5|nr:hypothetical protein [Segetibacter sp.]
MKNKSKKKLWTILSFIFHFRKRYTYTLFELNAPLRRSSCYSKAIEINGRIAVLYSNKDDDVNELMTLRTTVFSRSLYAL